MFRRSPFGFGSEDDPFERMMQEHNTVLNQLMGGSENPFGRPLFQDPMFSSMMDFHRSFSTPSLRTQQLPPRRVCVENHQPQRSLSVTEISDNHEDDMSEEERTQLELAIAQSIAESKAQARPKITDLDEEDNRPHYEENRFPPSNDNLVIVDEDEDVQMMDAAPPRPMIIEDDDDEELRQALELSRQEEQRRQALEKRSKEEIERNTLMEEQRSAYAESIRLDMEKRSRDQFKKGWLTMERALPSEPSESDLNATRLVIRLPTGQRINRRFLRSDTLSSVRTFVDSALAKEITSSSSPSSSSSPPTSSIQDFSSHPLYDYIPDSSSVQDQTYDLSTDFPNVVFKDDQKTLDEVGLHPRALVSVRSRK